MTSTNLESIIRQFEGAAEERGWDSKNWNPSASAKVWVEENIQPGQGEDILFAGSFGGGFAWFISLATDDFAFWYGTVEGCRPGDDADEEDIYLYETENIERIGFDEIDDIDQIFACC